MLKVPEHANGVGESYGGGATKSARSAPAWQDFIGLFLDFSEGALSPALFRKWTAIALVAGALERRVWAKNGPRLVYPNLYTLLVAPPGVGKSIIEEARGLWTECTEPGTKLGAFHVAPDSMTKASLVDSIAKARAVRIVPAGPPLTYHSLLIPAEEFSVLLPAYDMEYIGTLNSIFNNKALHEEVRRTGTVKELSIVNPQINILGGVQPSFLGSVFPEEAWASGFARRIIMIYSNETPRQSIFFEPELPAGARENLLGIMGKMSQFYGAMRWVPEAAEAIDAWHCNGAPPRPQHSKLTHYCNSRTLHALKLSIVSAVSRTGRLVIEKEDVERAIAWLLEAEHLMPDIFREMAGKSDTAVLEELRYFVTAVWNKQGRKAVEGHLLWDFLAQRLPSDKIERVLLAAERANVVVRVAGTETWRPRPKGESIEE